MMRKFLYIILLSVIPFVSFSQNNRLKGKTLKISQNSRLIGDVAIGSTSFDGSAIITITSSTKGALMPRMNTAARDAIGSPADGLLIYNNQTNQYEFFESTWQSVGGDGNGIYTGSASLSGNTTVSQDGNTLAFEGSVIDAFSVDGNTFSVDANNNRVGIGTSSPPNILTVDAALNDAITLRNTSSQIMAQIGRGGSGGTFVLRSETGASVIASINSGGNSFIIDGNDFGIGTSSPTTKLTVKSANNEGIQILDQDDDVMILMQHDNSIGGQFVMFDQTGSTVQVLYAGAAGSFVNVPNKNFGVGLSSSITAQLTVAGDNAASTSDAFLATDNVATVLMVIENAGDVGIGEADPSSKLDVGGDVEINSSNAFYLGDPGTDGTWRIIRSGDDLLMQQREAGTYNTKQTISGA